MAFFELDDIKRRHSYTFDVYNTFSWIDTPDNQFSWNLQRGAIIGVLSASINELQILFTENARLMLKEYQWPKTAKQYGIFLRETLRMDNFRHGIKNRLQYAFALGTLDIGSRIAAWRQLNAGWYRPFGSFDYQVFRKMPPTFLAAFLTCWISTPLELARHAYYGDKTFPKELQKGYTSYFNALRRIPFEEGPYYLFKNSFPYMARNFIQTMTMFYFYDYLRDKFGGVTYRISDFSMSLVKSLIAGVSVYFACVFSYPFGHVAREMVDFWPKEKPNVPNFGGNYRKAAVWLWYHEFGTNAYPGFGANYLWRQAPWMFLTLYMADSFGIFNVWQHDPYIGAGTNSWEDGFA